MDAGWEKYIEGIDKRLESVEGKIDKLLEFKWQIIGGSVLMSSILAVAIQIVSIFWGK